jgi:hypothetical protein
MATRTLSEEKKRQQKLLIILIAVVLLTLILLYFTLWSKKGNTVVIDQDINNMLPEGVDASMNIDNTQSVQKKLSPAMLEEKLKKVDLNIDFFNNTILPFLKLYGDLPVEKGETGRSNPFIP